MAIMIEEKKPIVPQIQYDPYGGQQYEEDYLKKHAIAPDDTAVSRFSAAYPTPTPYTPKQEQQTRNSASIAETLKSLAEIYGQSKGAQLRQRQPEENGKAEANILREKNKYDTDLREYARAMIAAGGQDSEKLRILRQNAEKHGQWAAKNEYDSKKAELDRDNKLSDAEAKRKYDAEQADKKIKANSTEKAKDRANSTKNAYIRKAGSNKALSPSDQKEFDATYSRAISDRDFQAHLVRSGVLIEGRSAFGEPSGEYKLSPLVQSKSKEDIVQMYQDWGNPLSQDEFYGKDGKRYRNIPASWIPEGSKSNNTPKVKQKEQPRSTTKNDPLGIL